VFAGGTGEIITYAFMNEFLCSAYGLDAENEVAGAGSSGSTWSHNDVLLLLDAYEKNRYHFRNPTMKKLQTWDIIAQEMNVVKGVAHFTGAICSKKWSNLEMRYKGKRDSMGKTGRGGGRWLYFDRMDELLGDRASVKALSDTCQPLIAPPSESCDDDQHDKEAMKSVSVSQTKRRRVGEQTKFEKCAEKLSKEMAETREKVDQRLERLENTERERLGVLKEMKDLMGVWVECMKKKHMTES